MCLASPCKWPLTIFGTVEVVIKIFKSLLVHYYEALLRRWTLSLTDSLQWSILLVKTRSQIQQATYGFCLAEWSPRLFRKYILLRSHECQLDSCHSCHCYRKTSLLPRPPPSFCYLPSSTADLDFERGSATHTHTWDAFAALARIFLDHLTRWALKVARLDQVVPVVDADHTRITDSRVTIVYYDSVTIL